MSDRLRFPAPVDGVIRRIEEAAAGDEERASTFARGVALGVLVGAAIAGSTLWQRRHASGARPRDAQAPEPAESPPPEPDQPDR